MIFYFQSSSHETEGTFNVVKSVKTSGRLFSMINRSSNNLNKIQFNQKIAKFVKFMAHFLNCKSTYDLTDVQASIYDKKTASRRFDLVHDILSLLILAQSLRKR